MSIKPIVLRPPGPDKPSSVRRAREPLAIVQNTVFVAVCVLAGFVSLLASYHIYLQAYESRNPSGHVYIETDGERVYLVQPTALITPPPIAPAPEVSLLPIGPEVTAIPSARRAVDALSSAAGDPLPTPVAADARPPAPTPRPDVPLPPVGLQLPAIDLSVEVRVATNDTLPEEPYAGWFFRSAFPATAGNVILLGHVDGDAAIFARLGELQPGDEVRVLTATSTHIYLVEWTAIVDDSAVEMLGPNSDPIVTLVTCFGEWNADRRAYESRMIVRAHYVAVEGREASS